MIHKKILEVAKANPDASLEGIADRVDGASAAFVERVLEEYGDPARHGRSSEQRDDVASSLETSASASEGVSESDLGGDAETGHDEDEGLPRPDEDGARSSEKELLTDGAAENGSESAITGTDSAESRTGDEPTSGEQPTDGATGDAETDDEDGVTDPSELSDKQRETLVAVADEPDATQAEIAQRLGVSRATVSKRLTDVPGFEWASRAEFVEGLFDYRGGRAGAAVDASSQDHGGDSTEAVDEARLADIESRLADIESRIDTLLAGGGRTDDPELAHKVIHACIDAEYVSREEELEVLRRILNYSDPAAGVRELEPTPDGESQNQRSRTD